MSLERKPAGRPNTDVPTPRTLTVASNPAQRLQELLRREAEQTREVAQPQEVVSPSEPKPTLAQSVAPPPAPVASIAPLPAPASPVPPPVEAPPKRKEDPVQMVVVVNSERNGPVEYASIEEMPTIVSLEETHRAFLLSDEWQRRGPTLMRVVRLRRRRR